MTEVDPPRIVGVAGSLRDESYTRIALEQALAAAGDAGAKTELLDLREFDLPVFDPDEPESAEERRLTETIKTADALILATPMYHGSYSSAIKNAIDYCGFEEFEHKTVGLLAVAGGSFPISALDHLRLVCRALDAWVLPFQAAVPNSRSNFSEGTIVDEALRDRVETLGVRVVRFARIQEIEPPTFESQENVGATH